MRTTSEIRRANLELLVEEAGGPVALANRCDVNSNYISQIRTGVKSSSGKPRGVGPKLARQLEAGMGKDSAWMDQDHQDEASAEVRESTAVYGEAAVLALAERIVALVGDEAASLKRGGAKLAEGDLFSRALPHILKHYLPGGK